MNQKRCCSSCCFLVADNDLNPVWNETFSGMTAPHHEILRVEVFDKDFVKSDDLLGMIEIPVSKLKIGLTYHQWHILEHPERVAKARREKKQKKRTAGEGPHDRDKSDFENAIQIRTDPHGVNVGRKYFFKVGAIFSLKQSSPLQTSHDVLRVSHRRQIRRHAKVCVYSWNVWSSGRRR